MSISSCESVFLLYLIGVIVSSRLAMEPAFNDEVDDELACVVLPPFLNRISGICGLTCLNDEVEREISIIGIAKTGALLVVAGHLQTSKFI